LVKLNQAWITKLETARPVGLIESPPRRPDRTRHIVDRAVSRLPGNLLAGRMDHLELASSAGQVQLTIDEHPLTTGQYAGVVLHACHCDSLLLVVGCGAGSGSDALPAGGCRGPRADGHGHPRRGAHAQ